MNNDLWELWERVYDHNHNYGWENSHEVYFQSEAVWGEFFETTFSQSFDKGSRFANAQSTIEKVSIVLSYGFNAKEAAQILGLHRVTVQRLRKQLREDFSRCDV